MVSELYDIGDVVSIFSHNKHKGMIGKECFFAASVEKVIEYANYGYGLSILSRIDYNNNTFLAINGKSYRYAIQKRKRILILDLLELLKSS